MNTFKKLLFPILSLFLAYQTYEIISYLIHLNPEKISVFTSILLAFLLSLFITGIFAFIGFAYPTSSLLPASYYSIKNPEMLSSLYKTLGLKYFRMFLLATFWGRKANRKKYFNGTKKGLTNFIFQTKQSEFGHLAGFVITAIVSILLIKYEYYYLVIAITVINVLANLYPIILQRYHRIRIEKALAPR